MEQDAIFIKNKDNYKRNNSGGTKWNTKDKYKDISEKYKATKEREKK